MSFDLMSVEGKHEEDEDYLHYSNLEFEVLRFVMRQAGVPWDVVRVRTGRAEERRPGRASLRTAFGDNSGWHVMPDECVLIAEKLEALALIPNKEGKTEWDEDLLLAEPLAHFCRVASALGGFYVC